jgi:hypothetical protein
LLIITNGINIQEILNSMLNQRMPMSSAQLVPTGIWLVRFYVMCFISTISPVQLDWFIKSQVVCGFPVIYVPKIPLGIIQKE